MNTYTRLPNDVIEVLLNPALNGDEMKILLYIARKTYGFNKKSDAISLTQFQNKLGMGRKYVNIALSRLRLVSLVILVKKGNSKKASNIYQIDYSDYATKLVSLSKLVSKIPKTTSFQGEAKILHTKESITKESLAADNISSNENALIASDAFVIEKLSSLLGEKFKYGDGKAYRLLDSQWIEIKYPTAYLKKIEANPTPPNEPQTKGDGFIDAKAIPDNY